MQAQQMKIITPGGACDECFRMLYSFRQLRKSDLHCRFLSNQQADHHKLIVFMLLVLHKRKINAGVNAGVCF